MKGLSVEDFWPVMEINDLNDLVFSTVPEAPVTDQDDPFGNLEAETLEDIYSIRADLGDGKFI